MFGKIILFCVQAFLIQTISAQCFGNPGLNYGLNNGIYGGNSIGLGTTNLGLANSFNGINSCGLGNPVASGGSFTVTSSSPIAPSGVSIASEYVIEGPLNVGGQLPLLGAVAVEGQVPTGGNAGATYSCGNGVGIVSDNLNADISAVNAASGLANAGLANAGLANTAINAGLANGFGLANAGINRVGGCGCAY